METRRYSKRSQACPELDLYQTEIETLYSVDRLTAEQIRQQINERYHLSATISQYRHKISRWGCRKNLTGAQVTAAEAALKKRPGKSSQAIISRRIPGSVRAVVSQKHLLRSIKRKQQSTPLVEQYRSERKFKQKNIFFDEITDDEDDDTTIPDADTTIHTAIYVVVNQIPTSTALVYIVPHGHFNDQAQPETPQTDMIVCTPESSKSPPALAFWLDDFSKLKLPIFVAKDDLQRLFYGWLNDPQSTHISQVRTSKHFTLLHSIIWQVSNNLIDYNTLDRLLERVNRLRFWGAFSQLFCSANLSISAACEMIIPTLYYRGRHIEALRIFQAQSRGYMSLYHILEKGDWISSVCGHDHSMHSCLAPENFENKRTFYRLILSDIISLGAFPRKAKEAIAALEACRIVQLPVINVVKNWKSLDFTIDTIDQHLAKVVSPRYFFPGAHFMERPLLDRSFSDVQTLLRLGIRDALLFQFLQSILRNHAEGAILCLRYSNLTTRLKSELEFCLTSERGFPRTAWDSFTLENFKIILQLTWAEVETFLFVGSTNVLETPTTCVRKTPQNASWQDLALLLYFARKNAPHSQYLATYFRHNFKESVLLEDMTIILEICIGIQRVYDMSGVQERQFIIEKLEWLSSLEVGGRTNLVISATSRMWEYVNYLFTGFQSDQQSQDWLEIQPCDRFIAGLAMKGALLNSPRPNGGHQRDHNSEYMIQIAFLAAEPDLFIYFLQQKVSLDPLELWTGSLSRWKYRPDDILLNAAAINDTEGIINRWPYRLHDCSMEPYDELSLTLKQPKIQARKVEEIILKHINLHLNPAIKYIDSDNARSWSDGTWPRSREETVCFEALNSIFSNFFETAGHGVAAGVHPAAVKSLHRETMQLTMQHRRNRDLFEMFFQYGAKAESIPYSKTICNRTRGFDQPSFMNIPFETIRNYAAVNIKILRILVQADEDVNPAWFQLELFLMAAVRDGNMNMAIWLLDQRVNHPEKCRNRSLKHAARLAIMRGRIDIVALLLESDPSCRETALDIAIKKRKYAIAEMIRSWNPGMPYQGVDAGEPQNGRCDTIKLKHPLQHFSPMTARPTDTSRAKAKAADDIDDKIEVIGGEQEAGGYDSLLTGPQYFSNSGISFTETLPSNLSRRTWGESLSGHFEGDILPWDSHSTFKTSAAENGLDLDDMQGWDMWDIF